jgi:hypothetical protein
VASLVIDAGENCHEFWQPTSASPPNAQSGLTALARHWLPAPMHDKKITEG